MPRCVLNTSPISCALGLGGNIGEPKRSMAQALRSLDQMDLIHVRDVSRLYRTPPWGKTDQAWFFNSCALIETYMQPHALLDACLSVERELKRERRERWGPRIIDIDVLTYSNRSVHEEGLTIPHPHMHERAFVLLPLLDIAPDLAVAGKRIAEWVAEADSAGIEAVSEDGLWWR
ncbi:2-amino-4-hydroxy-6-hydroxymethyldihydropteridine diphosphokinase [Hoeflea prorocentri]|uniref:2-amino-4-hydroxy-6-hydroxymethyldihydropteridine pyrophosphokinase n=1 Tax=Hoeflea prorocentri TaxID=1922333 RepID=A0A9X3UH22_9HYPH|nr:2-amino-4-hydroxy-6-hydroxymethyldihydropteridine diphosphokinase [Hoeflea prorocentri]MCY6380330.1 2-amino-4-hydroxy-6-hydroxymethyldihydropteridine diphosphokinase [Hoeflea prorocentri]MDA5398130.1 2-amino-4-hydroxy-6-hydroxymethyldihydropteridine diphosphokinase [Hoeflea prorocentri]